MRPRRFTPFTRRVLFGVAAAGALSLSVYGVTGANTVPATRAGAGSGGITGYTVSNVAYTLNAANPQNIDAVTFDLDTAPPAGSVIKVKLVSGGSDWYSCTYLVAAVTCATTAPQATVATADQLTVVAAE